MSYNFHVRLPKNLVKVLVGEVNKLGDATPGLIPKHIEGQGKMVADLPVWLHVAIQWQPAAIALVEHPI